MKVIYLTSGPRGAGKSTYCRKAASLNPNLKLIIRDDLLMELFGKTSLSPYEGGHFYAQEVVFKTIEKLLAAAANLYIILDFWNGFSRERKAIIERLRKLGADRVFCWQFQVEVDTCVKWFFEKSDSSGYIESGTRSDHALYYEESREINQDGFDRVFQINPLQSISLPLILGQD